MKINVLWVGKTKKKEMASLVRDYKTRIGPLAPFEIIEIHEDKDYSKLPVSEALKRESKKILKKINSRAAFVILDEKGSLLTSRELAKNMVQWSQSHREIIFIVGSHYGISPILKQKAFSSLSLSKMTFTHEMTRVILLEQIYRALTIIKKIPYHK